MRVLPAQDTLGGQLAFSLAVFAFSLSFLWHFLPFLLLFFLLCLYTPLFYSVSAFLSLVQPFLCLFAYTKGSILSFFLTTPSYLFIAYVQLPCPHTPGLSCQRYIAYFTHSYPHEVSILKYPYSHIHSFFAMLLLLVLQLILLACLLQKARICR